MLLFHYEELWTKKNVEEDVDIPIGCNDGAEFYELAGTFIINKISPIMQEEKSVGLWFGYIRKSAVT